MANTVLKMAKKRAQIDLTLTATAASDVFTQDIEDMPDEIRETIVEGEEGMGERPPISDPKSKSSNGKPILSEAQVKRFFAISQKTEATPEMISIIQDTVAPDRRTEGDEFDWNRVTRPEYDKLCNMFLDNTWKTFYSDIMAKKQ
jgi:hypothetical protein